MGLPLNSPVRGKQPCYGCTEKFILCHGDCPKDKRGEYGYAAWKAELEKAKQAKSEYERSRYNKYPR